MKSIWNVFITVSLAALIVFLMAACDMGNSNGGNEAKYGPTHFYGPLTFGSGSKIWEYNREWERISDLHKRFTGDRDLIVFVNIFDENNERIGEKTVGTGRITRGILSFSVDEPGPELLFGWGAMKARNFFYWEDADVDAPGVRGNEFMFRTTANERLTLEIITGTIESLSQELVRFIYVDRACRITGSVSADGIIAGGGASTDTYFYTENILDVTLEKGWNTLYRRQTFYIDERGDGRSGITLLIKNPLNFKWVLYPQNYDRERDE